MEKFFPKLALIILVGTALASCSSKPSDGPGLCSLDCGSAIIGSQDYGIEPLIEDINYRCFENQVHGEASLKWAVFKKSKTEGQGTEKIAVPNISISPYIVGAVRTTDDDGNDIGADDYQGALTPSDNFCSDSCGTISIKVNFLCPAEDRSEVSVYLFSGALKSDKVLINVESPGEDTDDTDDDTGDTTTTLLEY